jgi:hypothetical protein
VEGAGVLRKRISSRGRLGAAIAAIGAAACFAAAATADDIANNLDASIDAVAEVMPLTVGGASGTTSLYVTPRSGDGKSGCNLTGGTTLVLSVQSSNTAVATVSPTSVTFTSCGDIKSLTVTPLTTGSTTITATQSSNNTGGTFNLAPATFTVDVAPPPNTAPQVSVAGVTGGAGYDKGSVPAATCDVTDAEDGNSSFAATLSAVTGPYASDGIGQQTASCSYTDGGGLTASSSKTYSIIDPTAPTVGSTLDPASADGANGWYRSNVSLTWTITEPESPGSVVKTGCVDQGVTADQPATTYSCQATSAGGASSLESVTIKRDASDPTITAGASTPSGPYTSGTWTKQTVTVHYTCADVGPSGLAGSCPSDEAIAADTSAAGTDVSAGVSDNAGNSATSNTINVKVDKTAPEVTVSASRAADWNGWYNHAVTFSAQGTDVPSGIDTCESSSYGGPDSATASATRSCTDKAGNSSSDSVGFQYDATDPLLSPSVSPNPVVLNASAAAASGASDAPSGVAADSCGPVDTTSVGTHSVACSATDNAGNEATTSASYKVIYGAAGTCLGASGHQILQPINASWQTDLSVFKQGSTVPAKFRVCDANGVSIGAAGVVAKFALVQKLGLAGSETVDEPVFSTTPDAAFRWSSTDQQWIFNMSTKTLKAGSTYVYQVTLNDSSTIDFRYGLK